MGFTLPAVCRTRQLFSFRLSRTRLLKHFIADKNAIIFTQKFFEVFSGGDCTWKFVEVKVYA